MVLCLLSRDSHGDTTKLNHEETDRGPEIAIFPEKSEILILILEEAGAGASSSRTRTTTGSWSFLFCSRKHVAEMRQRREREQ